MKQSLHFKILTAAVLAVLLASSLAVVIPAGEAEASATDTSFTVTDTSGKTFSFAGPSTHIVVFGYAATLTVLECGGSSKIYACDTYGQQAYADQGLTFTGTTIPKMSSTSYDAIYTQLVQALGDGQLAKDDAIVLTTYSSAIAEGGLRDKLAAAGFTHVLFYGTMTTYDALIACVQALANIVGEGQSLVDNMKSVSSTVSATVTAKVTEKRDAIFIRYSASNGWGIGNTGSLAVAMMAIAGANNIGYDAGSSSSTIYDESKILQLLEAHPNAVIFMDATAYTESGKTVSDFIADFLGIHGHCAYPILVLERNWNNYDPDSATGIQEMAAALYPSYFTGTSQTSWSSPSEASSNLWIYVALGAIAVVAVLGAAYFVYRKKH